MEILGTTIDTRAIAEGFCGKILEAYGRDMLGAVAMGVVPEGMKEGIEDALFERYDTLRFYKDGVELTDAERAEYRPVVVAKLAREVLKDMGEYLRRRVDLLG